MSTIIHQPCDSHLSTIGTVFFLGALERGERGRLACRPIPLGAYPLKLQPVHLLKAPMDNRPYLYYVVDVPAEGDPLHSLRPLNNLRVYNLYIGRWRHLWTPRRSRNVPNMSMGPTSTRTWGQGVMSFGSPTVASSL